VARMFARGGVGVVVGIFASWVAGRDRQFRVDEDDA
jgi:hypothetical protein